MNKKMSSFSSGLCIVSLAFVCIFGGCTKRQKTTGIGTVLGAGAGAAIGGGFGGGVGAGVGAAVGGVTGGVIGNVIGTDKKRNHNNTDKQMKSKNNNGMNTK